MAEVSPLDPKAELIGKLRAVLKILQELDDWTKGCLFQIIPVVQQHAKLVQNCPPNQLEASHFEATIKANILDLEDGKDVSPIVEQLSLLFLGTKNSCFEFDFFSLPSYRFSAFSESP